MEDFKPEIEKDDEVEIDLGRLFLQLKKKAVFILAVTILFAFLSVFATKFLITKKYASNANIYLKPQITESGMVDNSTIAANSSMVNNYVLMLQGDTLLSDVSDKLHIKDENLVKDAISVSNIADSEIISVKATTDDPRLSKDIVDTTVHLFFETMKDKLEIKNMTILDQPKIELKPVSPSLKKNLVLGVLFGMMLSCGVVVIEFLLDKRLHTKQDAENYLEIPVLAEIPWIEEK